MLLRDKHTSAVNQHRETEGGMPCRLCCYSVGAVLAVGRCGWPGPRDVSLLAQLACCCAHCCPKRLPGARPRPPARLLLVSLDTVGAFRALLKLVAGLLRARLPANVLLVSLHVNG